MKQYNENKHSQYIEKARFEGLSEQQKNIVLNILTSPMQKSIKKISLEGILSTFDLVSQQSQAIVELKTKSVRSARSNSTSKGHKHSKNESIAIDILEFLYKADQSEFDRIAKGKSAIFSYSDIIAYMQSPQRREQNKDMWGSQSSYIKFAGTDWNYKSSNSNLGMHCMKLGFYTNVRKKNGKFEIFKIEKSSSQSYLDKKLDESICEKRHELFMRYLSDDQFDKKSFIEELNNLK